MSRTRRPIARSSHTVIGDNRNGESIGEGALGSVNLRSRFEHWNLDRVTHSRNWLATTVLVLALVALVLVAVGIVADTTGQSLAVSDPDGALGVAPWEPIALDEAAQRQLTSTSGEKVSSAEDLARRALLSDPLNSRALSF